jgi:hypothetical protein
MNKEGCVFSSLVFIAAVFIVPRTEASLITPYDIARAYVDATYSGYFDSNEHSAFTFDMYPASASILSPGVGNVSQSAFAEVDNGYFRSYVDTEGTGTTQQTGYGHAWAETQVLDTLTVNGYALIVPIHIDGSVNISYSLANPSLGIPGRVSFAIGCEGSTDTSSTQNTCTIGNSSVGLSYLWQSSTNVDLNLDFVIGTTPGVPFDFYWDTLLRADLGLPPGSATITGDFSQTGLFGPAEVLDQYGNVISNPQITSADGYNYLNPTGPASSSAPEPGVMATVGSGLIALGWAVRLRRKRLQRSPRVQD